MMENVVISNPKRFEELKKKFREDSAKKLLILSDFDRTLTHLFVEGERIPSMISILRSDEKYLGKEYCLKAQELFNKYHPFEINSTLPLERKKKLMDEWWRSHFELLIKLKLNKKILERLVSCKKIKLRKGAEDFFNLLKNCKIPLVIISASGIGDAIPMLLKKEGKLFQNIYIISNFFTWDKNRNAIGIKKPLIHSLNKNEIILKNFQFFEKIKKRKNVILLGDNLEDIEMVKGFDYNLLMKIGFLNENVKENLESYKKIYDVLILNDGSMEFIYFLLREIIKWRN